MTYAPTNRFASRFAIGLSTLLALSLSSVGCASSPSSGGTGGSTGSGTGGSSTGAGGGTGGSGAGTGGGTGGSGSGTGGSVGTGGSGTGGSVSTGGTTGIGGSVATGGTTGTGGSGTGGSAGKAGSSGSTGTGGSAGKGGSTGTGGTGGSAGSGALGNCTGLALCDTFESDTVGGAPKSSLWTIVNDGSGPAPVIDSIGAHGSSKSVKFVGSQLRVFIRNSSVIGTLGPVAHARYYVRFGNALPMGHAAFMVTHPTTDFSESNELRLGSQFSQLYVLHWNVSSDAANLPIIYNGDPSSFAPAVNTWYCVEATINTSNGHLNVSVNGTDIAGLTDDGVATANIDSDWVNAGAAVTKFYSSLADFNLGWRNFNGSDQMTVWFDDVALSGSPIGCVQ